MARITVEDCLKAENNRFALVQLASKRTKQLLHGSRAVIEDSRSNKSVVTALREIASGKVRFMTPDEALVAEEKEAEEARAIAEQEAAAAAGDISIADLLFKAPTISEEAALADDEGDDEPIEGEELDAADDDAADDDDDDTDELEAADDEDATDAPEARSAEDAAFEASSERADEPPFDAAAEDQASGAVEDSEGKKETEDF